MPHTSSKEEILLQRAKWVYISALLLVATLNIASHIIMDSIIHREAATARLVNLSGRQRMLSQRIVKLALERALHRGPHGDAAAQQRMQETVDRMATVHDGLLHGSSGLQLAPPSPDVLEVYVGSRWKLDAQVQAFLSHAHRLADTPASQLSLNAPDLLEMEDDARSPLLNALDAAVKANQDYSEKNINHMRLLLACFTALLLLLLLAEAGLLFRPLFNRITTQQKRLLSIGRTDLLTGCFNRRAFEELAPAAMDRARRAAEPLALLSLDLDHFKAVNDTYGHAAGDLVLQGFAATMAKHVRTSDLLCRIGGEEFILLLPHATQEDLPLVADRFRLAVQHASIMIGSTPLPITVSIGAATLEPSDETVADLMARADLALYQAKRAGRNCVVFAPATADVEPADEARMPAPARITHSVTPPQATPLPHWLQGTA